MTPDFYAPLAAVVDVLEQLRIRYYIGGSVASSVYGVRRATADVDIVADLSLAQAEPLVRRLEHDFYVDADAAREAIRLGTSFNLIHFSSVLKIDVFILRAEPYSQSEMARVRSSRLVESDEARLFSVASPEDTVLRKLLWYRATGEQSERQWRDVVGVLKLQATRLDHAYLAEWALRLGIAESLRRAVAEAESEP